MSLTWVEEGNRNVRGKRRTKAMATDRMESLLNECDLGDFLALSERIGIDDLSEA